MQSIAPAPIGFAHHLGGIAADMLRTRAHGDVRLQEAMPPLLAT